MAGATADMNIATRALKQEVVHVPMPVENWDEIGIVTSDSDIACYTRPEKGNFLLIGSEEGLELGLLLGCRQLSPVVPDEGYLELPVHHLKRPLDTVRVEGRAQDGVAVRHPVPAALEGE